MRVTSNSSGANASSHSFSNDSQYFGDDEAGVDDKAENSSAKDEVFRVLTKLRDRKFEPKLDLTLTVIIA